VSSNLDDLTVIRSRFQSIWSAAYPDVPYVFDNEPPVDEPGGPWVRLSVQPGVQRRRGRNSQGITYDQLGRVYLQVFVPDDEGDHDGWTMAEFVGHGLCDWRSHDWSLWIQSPTYSTSSQDGEPFMILVDLPYRSEHSRS
jgi:hypothetical protein